ncbi:hypothetical protein HU200_027381 [Digitaria exilis]|uniref:Scarecrow-like protein 9 n=1 Tax=Digitaria exilis TaxID=1010633 RepID=A0A835BWB8_9POAL|nr:hypothetical protein HU200_027381 [Digitaria exilis]
MVILAIDLEYFFVEGPMEPSPRALSDEGLHSPDDMVLSYISTMLMEDDIDDKLLHQYSDHPALLQEQQAFAQILSTPSFDPNNGTINLGNTEGGEGLLQDVSGDPSTADLGFSKGVDAVRAFLKGMEESIEFLPRDNGFIEDDLLNQKFGECSKLEELKKRYNRSVHLEEVGKSSTPMMVTEELEAMLGELMLQGYDTCTRDIEKLRIAMTDEVEKTEKGSKTTRYVVDLHTLLITCAQAVDANDWISSHELLQEIKQHASATGDATQRLAQCFLKGLEARLMGIGGQLSTFLMGQGPSVMESLEAYKMYVASCCFNKVTLNFNTMTILRTMTGKNKLHVVDYGLRYGFHWAGLLHLLANREDGPPDVKITAIGRPHLISFPVEHIEETGHRLSKCAREIGLPSFKFHVITAKWEVVCIENLKIDANEVLVVNDLFNFNTLMDESVYFDDPSPRDTVLNNIRKMRPDVFIQGVVNCLYGTSFLSRFREVLFYYAAMFDALDVTVPRENKQRLVLEQDIMGQCVLNVIACEGKDRMNRSNTYKQWQLRNQRAGLRQLPLDPKVVSTVRDVVKKHHYHKNFVINEDQQWLLQEWKGRILYAHSTWVADDSFAP